MRLLGLVVFLGLACGGQGTGDLLYRYEAQLATGSPESSHLYSGQKLNANLTIYHLIQQTYLLQLTDVSLQKMDKFLIEQTANYFLQEQAKLLEDIQAEVEKVMISKLRLPFTIEWFNGHVSDFRVADEDLPFSINVKRGILNLLQVNMDQLFSTDVNSNKGPGRAGQRTPYTVLESSPFGQCLTTYTPVMAPEYATPNSFYLIKVRNYTSCYPATSMVYSFDNLNSQNNYSSEHLNLQAEVTYAISGNKNAFTIESAFGQSKVSFIPYARQDGSVQTSINQTLYRLKDIELFGPVPAVSKINRKQDLTQTLPTESTEDRRPYVLKDSEPSKFSPWSLGKMDQILWFIANGTIEYPSDDLVVMTQTLMEMIRQTTKIRLSEFFYLVSKQQWDDLPPGSPPKLKTLWNLLSYAGTTTAAEIQLAACQQMQRGRQLPTYQECISAVTAIGLYTHPSEQVIVQLIELITPKGNQEGQLSQAAAAEEEDPGRTALVKAGALALGTLIGRANQLVIHLEKIGQSQKEVIEMIKERNQGPEVFSQLDRYEKNLTASLDRMRSRHIEIVLRVHATLVSMQTDESSRMLTIKAMRNSHTAQSVENLAEFLRPSEHSKVLRIAAAQAFETYVERRQLVLYILEEIVKNPQDIAAVRIQCFRSMVNLKAPVHTLIRLATAIAYENEKQLSTYVWSTFNKLANSTFRPYRQSAADFRDAMAMMQPVDTGIQDSQYRQVQADLADEISAIVESSIITTPDFRSTADIGSSLDIFGTASKLFQVTVTSEGLHEVWRRLLGPKGFLTNRNSFFDLFQRPKRATDVKEKIQEIFAELKIKLREVPEAKMYVDLQLMNRVVRLYDLNDIVQSLTNTDPFILAEINEGKWKAGVEFQHNSSGIINQFFLELPTEAGFPVNLQMGLSFSGKVKGKVTGGVEASIYKDKREEKPPVQAHFSLELAPEIVASVTGKMSVDGYLFQTGSWLEAQINHQAYSFFNASYDIPQKRLLVKFSPSVSSEVPLLKMEMKPYVFSRALPSEIPVSDPTVNDPFTETNQRPVFYTMQPVIIGLGTQLKQVNYQYGKEKEGYTLTVQGQYPYRGVPASPASPLSGRSHFAVYLDSGAENPPELSLDVKYFPVSYSGKKACYSWLFFECYGSGDDNDVQPTQLPQEIPQGKISGIPDLGSPISFQSLKRDILEKMGQKIQPEAEKEWAFVAVLNGTSSLVIQGMMQSWNEGQYHSWLVNAADYSITNPGTKLWEAHTGTSVIYPSKVYSVDDLLDSEHQLDIHEKVFQTMEYREHRVSNRYFQSLLFTLVNNYAIRNLPSMDPQILLDRIFPAFVLKQTTPNIIRVRLILKSLLPLTHDIIELSSEMENSFAITLKQDLITWLLFEILENQNRIEGLLKKVQGQSIVFRDTIASIEYTVLKMTQSVLHIKEIVKRATDLLLVSDPTKMLYELKKVEQKQLDIYQLCSDVLVPKTSAVANEQTVSAFDLNPNYPVGYGRISNPVYDSRDSVQEGDIIRDLKALTAQQLHQIRDIFELLMKDESPTHDSIVPLIQNTADNISNINEVIKQPVLSHNETLTKLILQVTTQHQIIVHILWLARFKLKPVSNYVNNVDRYSLKVQTKELLERGNILQLQGKTAAVCYPSLNDTQKPLLKNLQKADRLLVSLQQDHIRLPTDESPWTASSDNVQSALKTLNDVLNDLKKTTDSIAALQSMPHPCLMAKHLDTLTTLQLKVSIFKRTLLAQFDDERLKQQYEDFDEQTMDLVTSLTPIFDKYITAPDKEKVFPRGNIIISQSLVDLGKIFDKQHNLQDMLDKYLNRPGPVHPSVAKKIIREVYQRSKEVLKRLQDASQGLKSSAHTTSLTAYGVLKHLQNRLAKQTELYDRIKEQLQLFPEADSDIRINMEEDRSRVEKLEESCRIYSQGSEDPIVTSPSPLDLNDFMNEMNQFDSKSNEIKRTTQAHQQLPLVPAKVGSILEGVLIVSNISITYPDKPQESVTITVYAKKTVEQLLWEATQYYAQNRDHSVSKSVEDSVSKREYMKKNCRDTCMHLNSYNHVHLHAQVHSPASNLSETLGAKAQTMMQKMMYAHYDRTELLDAQSFIDKGTMQIIFDFSHLLDSVEEYFMTTVETLAIQSVPVPQILTAINPFQNLLPVSALAQQQLSNNLYPAYCSLQYMNLKTTDGFVYQLPNLHERILLAADCSPEMSFAIVVHNEAQTDLPNKQSLQILAQDHEVQLISNAISIDVVLDDKVTVVNEGKPVIIDTTLPYGVKVVALELSRDATGAIRAWYPLAGLDIYFSINQLSVKMSPVFSSQLCGLCGNFDGQITKELEGPEEHIFYEPLKFTSAYSLGLKRHY